MNTKDFSKRQFQSSLAFHGFEPSGVMGWKDTTGGAPGVCFMPVIDRNGRVHRRLTVERMLARRAEHSKEKRRAE